MQAVVFDLYGTLTDPRSELGRRARVEQTGRALGVEPGAFWAAWSDAFAARITGRYGSTERTLRRLAQECGTEVSGAVLTAACAQHLAAMEQVRQPRPGALAMLATLRARGFRLGLVSDCSREVAEGWDASPYAGRFDAVVLSFHEGYRKPDPHLFRAAADRLDVDPTQCWYVGDGGGREHSGARAAGMRPVLVTNAGVPDAAVLRADADGWLPACQVADLDGLLPLLGAANHKTGVSDLLAPGGAGRSVHVGYLGLGHGHPIG